MWDIDFDDTINIPNLDSLENADIVAQLDINIDSESDAQAFADDSQVIVVSENLFEGQKLTNLLLAKLSNHAKEKKQSYNVSKTKAMIFTKRKIPFPLELYLDNLQIKILQKTKLLGVTLDSHLTWRSHIDNQVSKCKKLIFALNSCCKLKWGISPNILRTIWTGVIEQIALYGSPAWASCIDKKWLSSKLESLQRLMSIKIIKSFKNVSYESSLHLSGLTPIMQRLKERCLTYAAKHSQHYLSLSHVPHINNILNLANSFDLDIGVYEKGYQTCIPPYSQISPHIDVTMSSDFPLVQHNLIIIYTDGSKTEDKTGCAFVLFPPSGILRHGTYKLNNLNSVYQAELYAIYCSLKELFHMPMSLICSCQINIFSDSLSSIFTIMDSSTDNIIAQEILKYFRFFSSITSIKLFWCKAHSKILGNEIADFLAKSSTTDGANHESKIAIPISSLKSAVKKQEKLNWLRRWEGSTKGRTTFSFMPGNPPKHYNQLHYDHKMTQILTGHSRLNMYLHSIGVEDINPRCECDEDVETSEHYLFECSLYDEYRHKTIEKTAMEHALAFPPSNQTFISHPDMYKALKSFLQTSCRLEFE